MNTIDCADGSRVCMRECVRAHLLLQRLGRLDQLAKFVRGLWDPVVRPTSVLDVPDNHGLARGGAG